MKLSSTVTKQTAALVIGLASVLATGPNAGPSRNATGTIARTEARGRYADATRLNSNALPLEIAGGETKARAKHLYGDLPLSFEANEGQADSSVKFLSRASAQTLFLTATEAVLKVRSKAPVSRLEKPVLPFDPTVQQTAATEPKTSVLRMKLVGANDKAKVTGLDELPGKSNYFIGDDPGDWKTNVTQYHKVRYQEVYPGVDAIFYGNQKQLEYDFVVAPGGEAGAINLAFEGAQSIRVDESGDLLINTPAGEIRQHKPFAYQEFNGVKNQVDVQFALNEAQEIRFEVSDYDAQRPLIIDPVIVYSSLLGGINSEAAAAIAVDAAHNIYVAGATGSPDFPSTGPPFPNNNAYISAYITKFDPTGKNIIYSTYVGGYNYDAITSMALDAAGNAYVTGWTTSSNFPTTPGAYQTQYKGGDFDNLFGGDGFIVKFNASGNTLLYSTLLGGNLADNFRSIAVDSQGNAYVAGYSWSIDFPSTPGAYQTLNHASPFFYPYANNVNEDSFVAKLNANGTNLLFSTFIGGASIEYLGDMKLDAANNVVVAGFTLSDDYPKTPGAYIGTAPYGLCVTKLNSRGSGLISSTVIGFGSAAGVALDNSDNVYVCGNARLGFPTTSGVIQPEPLNDGSGDGIVTKLNAELSQIIYSTFLGGGYYDAGYKIAVDSAGNACVTGVASYGFPTTPDAFQPAFGGVPGNPYAGGFSDAFFAKLNPTATALVYSTYLGGIDDGNAYGIDQGQALALDGLGNAYIAGYTSSTTFPTTPGAFRPSHPLYDFDAFFAKFEFFQFDLCLQDDSSGSIFQINTSTGDYQFTNCLGVALGGTAMITKKGCLLSLQATGPDRRVLARVDTCQKTATTTIQFFTQGKIFTILDRNITNNACGCSG